MKKTLRCIGVTAAVLLAGCSDDPAPQESAQAPVGVKKPPLTAEQREVNKQTAQMVTAVETDDTPPIATVKFDLQARPEIGKPLTIKLAFTPQPRAEMLTATYVADAGLTVNPPVTPAEFSALELGKVYFHEVTVVPKQNGVQYLSAVVQLRMPVGEPLIQSFFIPIVVGPPPAG